MRSIIRDYGCDSERFCNNYATYKVVFGDSYSDTYYACGIHLTKIIELANTNPVTVYTIRRNR